MNLEREVPVVRDHITGHYLFCANPSFNRVLVLHRNICARVKLSNYPFHVIACKFAWSYQNQFRKRESIATPESLPYLSFFLYFQCSVAREEVSGDFCALRARILGEFPCFAFRRSQWPRRGRFYRIVKGRNRLTCPSYWRAQLPVSSRIRATTPSRWHRVGVGTRPGQRRRLARIRYV